MSDFFFKPIDIWQAYELNTLLLFKIGIVIALLIPIGFLLERFSPRWRRIGVFTLVAVFVAGLFTSAQAADLTPCVVCTLDSILALVVCYMFWC